MSEQGYTRCHFDHCVYLKRQNDGNYIILLLYVDDMIVAGSKHAGNKCSQNKIGKLICNEGIGCCKTNPQYENNRDKKN